MPSTVQEVTIITIPSENLSAIYYDDLLYASGSGLTISEGYLSVLERDSKVTWQEFKDDSLLPSSEFPKSLAALRSFIVSLSDKPRINVDVKALNITLDKNGILSVPTDSLPEFANLVFKQVQN